MALREDRNNKGFGQPAQPKQQPIGEGQMRLGAPGSAEQAISSLEEKAVQTLQGLQSADAHFAAEILSEKQQQFEIATDAIGEVLSYYDDPEVKVMVGVLKSADKVNQRRGLGKSRLSQTLTGYTFPSTSLPATSSFSRFYSDSSRSEAPQLLGTNGESTNNSGEESIESPQSNS